MKPQYVFRTCIALVEGHVYAINKLTSDAGGRVHRSNESSNYRKSSASETSFPISMIEHPARDRVGQCQQIITRSRAPFSKRFNDCHHRHQPIHAIFETNYSVELFNCARGERKGAQGSVFNGEVCNKWKVLRKELRNVLGVLELLAPRFDENFSNSLQVR